MSEYVPPILQTPWELVLGGHWRLLYTSLRKRVIPWCMKRGCWERSVVMPGRVLRGRRVYPRGNVCPRHLLEAIMVDDMPEAERKEPGA